MYAIRVKNTDRLLKIDPQASDGDISYVLNDYGCGFIWECDSYDDAKKLLENKAHLGSGVELDPEIDCSLFLSEETHEIVELTYSVKPVGSL